MKYLGHIKISIFLLLFGLFSSCEKMNDQFVDFTIGTQEYNGTTWEYIYNQYGVYDSLVIAVERFPELKQYLQSTDSVTVFAVSNRSFEIALSSLNQVRTQGNRRPVYIQDLNAGELKSLLSYYIFPQQLTTESIRNLKEGLYVYGYGDDYQMHVQFQNTMASGLVGFGPQQIIFSDTNNSTFHRFWTRTVTSSINIKTNNGVVHMINPGHDFGFNKLIPLFKN